MLDNYHFGSYFESVSKQVLDDLNKINFACQRIKKLDKVNKYNNFGKSDFKQMIFKYF